MNQLVLKYFLKLGNLFYLIYLMQAIFLISLQIKYVRIPLIYT